MSSPRVLIYLLRRDLRLADNPILHEISKSCQQSQRPYTHVLPVYCFPAQQIDLSGFLSSDSDRSPYPDARSQAGGFWRCGHHRARFVAESVWDLKKSLEAIDSGLEIRVGMLGQVVKDMLEAFRRTNSEVFGVWMTAEEGVEEKREERDVRTVVEADGKDFKLWVDEKYYIDEYVCTPFSSAKGLPHYRIHGIPRSRDLQSLPETIYSQRHTDISIVATCLLAIPERHLTYSLHIANKSNLSGRHPAVPCLHLKSFYPFRRRFHLSRRRLRFRLL